MSDNTINGNSQGNLVGELISEMQRTNPPHVFNVDSNGNQTGSAQGQLGMNAMAMQGQVGGMQPNMQGQGQGQGGQIPINPQLQQQFMFVLQQSPQLQQMFQNPQALQQVLQNPSVMMNLIAQHQQMQAAQANQARQFQPNSQQIEQIQQSASNQDEEDDDDVNPDQMMNLQGPVQYEEDIGDVNIPETLKVHKSPDKSFTENLLTDFKGPLIATILFIIFMQPSVRDFIIKMIPKIQESVPLQTLTFASLFFTTNFLVKKLVDMF